jgi:hypothetical protein
VYAGWVSHGGHANMPVRSGHPGPALLPPEPAEPPEVAEPPEPESPPPPDESEDVGDPALEHAAIAVIAMNKFKRLMIMFAPFLDVTSTPPTRRTACELATSKLNAVQHSGAKGRLFRSRGSSQNVTRTCHVSPACRIVRREVLAFCFAGAASSEWRESCESHSKTRVLVDSETPMRGVGSGRCA